MSPKKISDKELFEIREKINYRKATNCYSCLFSSYQNCFEDRQVCSKHLVPINFLNVCDEWKKYQ